MNRSRGDRARLSTRTFNLRKYWNNLY